MRHLLESLPGWAGTLFVSACCLGAGPVLASAAVASGAGVLAGIFSIYVLGPLVLASVAWTVWTTYRLGRRLSERAHVYGPFWTSLAGGLAVVVGVFLPPLVAGSRPLAGALIYAGVAVLAAGSIWSVIHRRRAAGRRLSRAAEAGAE